MTRRISKYDILYGIAAVILVVVGQLFGWAVAGHILAFGAGIGAHRAYLWWRRR